MPTELARKVAGLEASPVTIVLAILLVYFVLGCFMESLAMVLLTLPVFIPLVLALDLGLSKDALLVWFGILVLISVEVGMISPPFGLNLFLINAMAKDVPMRETYKGVIGFCAMDAVRIALIVLFPVIALWLPGVK
jgi:TRAP-type C4-dicarboxylate transport system permease large subunit